MSREDRAKAVEVAWRALVEALGYDLKDPHLTDSPARVAKFMVAWHSTHRAPPLLTSFPNVPVADELVAVGKLPFFSLCAHHGLPFWGHAAVGYIPSKRVLGLSKFARVVNHFANRFQTQERITVEVAEHLEEALKPTGVAVVLRAEHMCMSMRGVKCPGHSTVTSAMRGVFRSDQSARQELLALLGAK